MLGPSGQGATLGSDQNSIVFSELGFATPYINIGPTQDPLNPGAIGGWFVGTPEYDIIAQQKIPRGVYLDLHDIFIHLYVVNLVLLV
jgi:hypothetical protein